MPCRTSAGRWEQKRGRWGTPGAVRCARQARSSWALNTTAGLDKAFGVSIVQVRKGDCLDRKGSCGCTKRYIKLLMNWAGGTGQEVKRTHDS